MLSRENELLSEQHLFICVDFYMDRLIVSYAEQLKYLKNNFCGLVIDDLADFYQLKNINYTNRLIYICGDIVNMMAEIAKMVKIDSNFLKNLNIICELSDNYDNFSECNLINIGQVPININNVGVYFRQYFNSSVDYFDNINMEHKFQLLTDSNKPTSAYRKGLYISKVIPTDNGLKFNLLRCSTNLEGPTDNFRATDHKIVSQVNNLGRLFFEQSTEFNHILAQIYTNLKIDNTDKKAKIKAHSDKTKDMPINGLMAFCTFYQGYHNDLFPNLPKDVNRSKNDIYDFVYKDVSVLTTLRFRLKNPLSYPDLVEKFDVKLYPNSVFIMSLKSNRLYTHEIVPSSLTIDKLPIRMGYVIRCSNTEAIYQNNQTYLNYDNNLVKLEETSDKDIEEIKQLYFYENSADTNIKYPQINYSLNMGDYMEPIL
jgi:hypothetical protein